MPIADFRMTLLVWLLAASLFLFPALPGLRAAGQGEARAGGSKAKQAAPRVKSANLAVAPDLAGRLAKFRPVKMPFHSAGLSARERQLVEKLVEASHYLEDIYWRQSDPEGLALYRSLASSQSPADKKLRRFLLINGSRFDLIDNNKPFVGTEPISPGHGLYPKGLTREQIEQYVREHPEKKAEIYSPYSVVHSRGAELVGVPYHEAYREFLEPAAKALREAAALSRDPAVAKFLRLRAEALLSDDYYPSDLAWLDLQDPKFDVIFAPYETYLDDLLGVKTSYGTAVLVRKTVAQVAGAERCVHHFHRCAVAALGGAVCWRERQRVLDVGHVFLERGQLAAFLLVSGRGR